MDMPSTTIPETNRLMPAPLAAHGETPAAFGRRCIPAGCVAPRSNTPGILARRALPPGRIAALGATLDFHHGLLSGSLSCSSRCCGIVDLDTERQIRDSHSQRL